MTNEQAERPHLLLVDAYVPSHIDTNAVRWCLL